MASSSFYTYRFQNRFPVSHLFLEIFSQVAEKSPETTVLDNICIALQGLGRDPPYPSEMVDAIIEDMQKIREEREKRAEKSKPVVSRGKKGPGAGFHKWLNKQDIESVLIVACNFNYEAAYQLYAHAPVSVVDDIIRLRIETEEQRIHATFEAVVYGTGAKMKGGDPDVLVDASAAASNNPDFKAALARAGFARPS